MKKFILALALFIGAGSAGTAIASTQQPENITEKTEQSDKRDGKKERIEGHKKMEALKGKKFVNPFDGLQLSEEQKNQIKELQKTIYGDRESKETKSEKKGDDKFAKKMNRVENKKKFLEGLKAILTPEQYVQFLENNYIQKNDLKGMGNKTHGKKQAKPYIKAEKPQQ